MIEAIRQLAEALPLEQHYNWKMPDDLPLEIPAECQGAFARNVYLKENLAQLLHNDPDLTTHYWIIRKWGGIRAFQVNERNNKIIREFRQQLSQRRLRRPTFNLISSLSKLASFWFPAQYSIYDSRTVFSSNWLLFRYTADRRLFPQPSGRSTALAQYDTGTLFRLSRLPYQEHASNTAYHEYCELLQSLSRRALDQERPYHLEMLLFIAAPSLIIQDIEAHSNVTIQTNAQ